VILPTYEPAEPDRNPMFLEKRVYQGSSGRVYPLPFIDRISETPSDRSWEAVYLENEYLSLMLLPEIGGRIHVGRDRTNGYDFFYRQDVIKPALVGLAGPWISGGVEFNWPQHHRPSTFMPTDVHIEHSQDGSVTVWMSEHEPMNRMKGMHGVCLHPGRSVIELKVRLYNRTPYTQTFLWWANVAARVHEAYRSFFPPDVHTVADHAKRAMSAYPLCEDRYYGVDYGGRARHGVPVAERPSAYVPSSSAGCVPAYAENDLSWYANIPVPTSYMCLGTSEDFFGGYDAFAEAGLIHVADHRIAPGKKQWTWGNHDFGYAWDRNLTDGGGPYIELMAGVYTDNQPDFSFIAPGETKIFSQYWYPYRQIGIAQYANIDLALSITREGDGSRVGVAATKSIGEAQVSVLAGDSVVQTWTADLAPNLPFIAHLEAKGPLRLRVEDGHGAILAEYEERTPRTAQNFEPATEPAEPAAMASTDELYLTGLHLEQYRHATRDPAPYWREALKRDPGDTRCNNALGLWHLKRGEFELARERFEAAITRATARNPNPYDGEPFYNLGLVLRFLGRDSEAEDAFAKAVWNSNWQAAGHYALAELACKRADWIAASDHLERSLRKDADQFKARDLKAMVLQRLGKREEADALIAITLGLDPLDFWARTLCQQDGRCDNGVKIDIAIDMMRAGFYREAFELVRTADRDASDGTAPMVLYYEGYLGGLLNEESAEPFAAASQVDPSYCFPSRLEDILVLQAAMAANESDSRAPYYLGNLFYDRRRHREAIQLWERAIQLDPMNSVAHRNLGIAAFNVLHKPGRARAAYEAAVKASPDDARIRYERDQLWKRMGVTPDRRLRQLRERTDLVLRRDDLTIEFCSLLNAVGKPEEAESILSSRRFQPWEGGEGQVLGVFSKTHLALGRKAMAEGDARSAKAHFELSLHPPENLGEARHLLANASENWLALGDAHQALGETEAARRLWSQAAEFRGDFQEMSVREFSELTYFQALALECLGRCHESQPLLRAMGNYARELGRSTAKIDYFATSLPTLLLFDDDLQERQQNRARLMQAQAAAGLGRRKVALALIDEVLRIDPNQTLASDLRTSLGEAAKTMR
jgi:tetratricopeptide (TPR) repeat protein